MHPQPEYPVGGAGARAAAATVQHESLRPAAAASESDSTSVQFVLQPAPAATTSVQPVLPPPAATTTVQLVLPPLAAAATAAVRWRRHNPRDVRQPLGFLVRELPMEPF